MFAVELSFQELLYCEQWVKQGELRRANKIHTIKSWAERGETVKI